jgi:hypothetical protein
MTAMRTLIDTLKRRAGDMARPFIDAARRPDASTSARAFGEAAQLILRDAETRAQQLPRKEFEQRVKAFKDWHRRHEVTLRRELAKLSQRGLGGDPDGRLSEVRARRPSSTIARRNSTIGWKATHWLRGSAPPRTC